MSLFPAIIPSSLRSCAEVYMQDRVCGLRLAALYGWDESEVLDAVQRINKEA